MGHLFCSKLKLLMHLSDYCQEYMKMLQLSICCFLLCRCNTELIKWNAVIIKWNALIKKSKTVFRHCRCKNGMTITSWKDFFCRHIIFGLANLVHKLDQWKRKLLQYQLYEYKCIYRFVVFHLKDYFEMQ